MGPDDWCARFHSDDDLTVASDECPDRATLAAVQGIPVFDPDGRSRPFGSLYHPDTATHPRQMIIFVRHFYCGACQAYLRAVGDGIGLRDYFSIPTPTSIVVIGCGQPSLIPHYKTFTRCPFPVFADPSRLLFRKLGMAAGLQIGRERPEYLRDTSTAAMLVSPVSTITRSLRDPQGIRTRDAFRGGNLLQMGGEFLFEDGRVTWCHRMKNYRDHTEVKALRSLLGLDQ